MPKESVCEYCGGMFVSVCELNVHRETCDAVITNPLDLTGANPSILAKVSPKYNKEFVEETAKNIVKVLVASVRTNPQHINYLQVSSASMPNIVGHKGVRRTVLRMLSEKFPGSESWWNAGTNVINLKLARKDPAKIDPTKTHIKITHAPKAGVTQKAGAPKRGTTGKK